MKTHTMNTEARIYVGTYAKYNSGSIQGEWLTASDYTDKEDFLKACAELHSDEADPELMFQDYEGIPKGMVSESSVEDALWEWLELDEDEQTLLAVYQEHVNQDGTIEEARDCFHGTFRTKEDYAEDYMESAGGLERMPQNLRCYFDFEAYARDCELSGDVTFAEHEGEYWVFSN